MDKKTLFILIPFGIILLALAVYFIIKHTEELTPPNSPRPSPKPPGPVPGRPPWPPPNKCPKIGPSPNFIPTKDWNCVKGAVTKVGENKGKFYTKEGATSMCSTKSKYECNNGKCVKSDDPYALYDESNCGGEGACSIVSTANPTLPDPNDYPATANYSQTPCQDPSTFDPNKPAYNIDPRMMLGSSHHFINSSN